MGVNEIGSIIGMKLSIGSSSCYIIKDFWSWFNKWVQIKGDRLSELRALYKG